MLETFSPIDGCLPLSDEMLLPLDAI